MNRSKGIYLALITAFISGVSIFVNKFAVGVIKSPLVFTADKNFMVGLLMLVILLVSGKWRSIGSVSKQDKLKLLLISIVGGSLPFYLFFTGLSLTSAVNAALIHKTLVLWVAILASPFLGERLSKKQGLAILLLFSGNLLVGGFKGFLFSKGELMVLAATLLWAAETIIAKKVLARVDADIVAVSRMGLGSLFLVGAAVLTSPQSLLSAFSMTGSQWFCMLLTVVFLLGYVTSWYRALKIAPAILVSTVLVLSTLVTNFLSAIFITHSWDQVMIPQAGLMMLGLGLYWASLRGTASKASRISVVQ